MNTNDVDEQIKLAMHYKHQNKIAQALSIEEDCLERCKKERGTPPEGIAMLLKALGKLYYVEKKNAKARKMFTGAIELYIYLCENVDPGYQAEVLNCAFYLGACSTDFINSSHYEIHRRGLQTGGPSAGDPRSGISMQVVQQLMQRGLTMVTDGSAKNPTKSTVDEILGRTG